MNIDSLQRIILAVAQSQGRDSVLQEIVQGLAQEPDVALTRIWLIGPGDICTSCPMRSVCPDQTRCLHLVASAGNPLIEPGSEDRPREDWTRIDGHFRRIPLNTPFKLGHIATTGEPIQIRIHDKGGEQLWLSRPDWVKAQKIRSFAGQPLIFRGEILGALAVFSRTELSEREFGWLRTFADHAAVAITNVADHRTNHGAQYPGHRDGGALAIGFREIGHRRGLERCQRPVSGCESRLREGPGLHAGGTPEALVL